MRREAALLALLLAAACNSRRYPDEVLVAMPDEAIERLNARALEEPDGFRHGDRVAILRERARRMEREADTLSGR